ARAAAARNVGLRVGPGQTEKDVQECGASDQAACSTPKPLVENKNHYVCDTTWRVNHHQVLHRNGPHSMAILGNLTLGLFRLNGNNKIKEAIEKIHRDRNRATLLVT